MADYAAVFDMLNRLSGFETEEKVAQAIFDLFDRTCAPALQGYLPGREDRPVTWLTSPATAPPSEGLVEKLAGLREPYVWTESGAGFVVRLQRDRETTKGDPLNSDGNKGQGDDRETPRPGERP